jgi:hypothetical protein
MPPLSGARLCWAQSCESHFVRTISLSVCEGYMPRKSRRETPIERIFLEVTHPRCAYVAWCSWVTLEIAIPSS